MGFKFPATVQSLKQLEYNCGLAYLEHLLLQSEITTLGDTKSNKIQY